MISIGLSGYSQTPLCENLSILIKDNDYDIDYKTKNIPKFLKEQLAIQTGKKIKLTNSTKTSTNSKKLSFVAHNKNIWIIGYEEDGWAGGHSKFYFFLYEDGVIKDSCGIMIAGYWVNWYQLKNLINEKGYFFIK